MTSLQTRRSLYVVLYVGLSNHTAGSKSAFLFWKPGPILRGVSDTTCNSLNAQDWRIARLVVQFNAYPNYTHDESWFHRSFFHLVRLSIFHWEDGYGEERMVQIKRLIKSSELDERQER